MQRMVSLVSLLVLGLARTLPEALIITQDRFDLGRFTGQWYEAAVASTCPHFMQRRRGSPVIAAVELQHVASEDNFTMTVTTLRNGSCMKTSTDYGLTDTPGQFFYHVARFSADVDSYVVHTNYDEYAMMLLMSTEQPSGNKTTIVKLYSRARDASPAVLGKFRTLVRQLGMSDDAIIINHKEDCLPVERVTEPAAQPEVK